MKATEVMAWLEARLPEISAWPDGRAEDVWRWYWHHGAAAVLTEAGAIVAAGAARVTDREHLEEPYHCNPRGDVIYIRMMAADTPAGVRGLWRCMDALLGARPWIAFRRGERSQLRVLPCERFARLINHSSEELNHGRRRTRAA